MYNRSVRPHARLAQTASAQDENFRVLFESSSDAIFVGLPDGTLTAVNPSACKLMGRSQDELLRLNARDLVAPEWLDVVDQHASRKLEGLEREALYELAFLDSAGTRIPVEMRSTVITVDNRIVGMHAVVRDMRDRRRAETALQESELRFQSAFDAPLVGMMLASPDGRCLKVNTALCQLLDREERDLLGASFADLVHPDDRGEILELEQSMLAGHRPTFQARIRLRCLAGRYVKVDLSSSLVRDAGGLPAYAIAQVIQCEPPAAAARVDEVECPLTERERQVLTRLAKGQTTTEIAAVLSISQETVHTYTRRATSKLRARTRTQAVVKAAAAGWLDDAEVGLSE